MRSIIFYFCFIVLSKLGGFAQNHFQVVLKDSIFKTTVEKFIKNLGDTIEIHPFPSPEDSSKYVSNLLSLLDKEMETDEIFVKNQKYSDFSFSTKSYDLSIYEIVLREDLKQIKDQIIKVKGEAPLTMKIVPMGKRILIYSYSPFKNNEKLKKAINKFQVIYVDTIKQINN